MILEHNLSDFFYLSIDISCFWPHILFFLFWIWLLLMINIWFFSLFVFLFITFFFICLRKLFLLWSGFDTCIRREKLISIWFLSCGKLISFWNHFFLHSFIFLYTAPGSSLVWSWLMLLLDVTFVIFAGSSQRGFGLFFWVWRLWR